MFLPAIKRLEKEDWPAYYLIGELVVGFQTVFIILETGWGYGWTPFEIDPEEFGLQSV